VFAEQSVGLDGPLRQHDPQRAVAAGFLLGGLQKLERCGRVALRVDGVEGEECHRVGAVVAVVGLASGSDRGSPVVTGLVGVAGVECNPAGEARDLCDGASKLSRSCVGVGGLRDELREQVEAAGRER
jgi:hypothetical protein